MAGKQWWRLGTLLPLAVTLHGALSPAEQAAARTPAGAALLPGLSEHDEAINLAHLDARTGRGDRAFRDQRAGAVVLVRGLQP